MTAGLIVLAGLRSTLIFILQSGDIFVLGKVVRDSVLLTFDGVPPATTKYSSWPGLTSTPI